MPLDPNFLQLTMEQCQLRLNDQGELVLTNPESPGISPPATLGVWAPRALPTGLDLGVAGELHHTLVA